MGKTKGGSVSFWSWFFLIFVMAIPCLGLIVVTIMAFTDSNESRRNFCRAHLAWIAVILLAYVVLIALGQPPDLGLKWDELTSPKR